MKAAQYALEKKATDIHVLDLREITSMTDYFVVATGTSDRQVKAIAENVIAEMRDTEGVGAWRSEGWDSLHWVIIDFVDFVVHVFQTESRQFYNIERLWADAPMTEVKDEISTPKTKAPTKKKPAAAKATRAKKVAAVNATTGPKIKVISDSRNKATQKYI